MPEGPVRGWFDDPDLLRSLPRHMRWYAAYCRLAVNRSSGVVPGGSFLFRILRRLAPVLRLPREALVRVGSRRLYVDLTDQRIFWVFAELRGADPEWRVLRDVLGPGDTFLDVGANHGSFSVLASELVGPAGRVVAVEPQPRLAELLARSLALANAPSDVHAVALGDGDGTVTLHVPDAGSGSSSVFSGYAPGAGSTVNVPLRRADELLAWTSYPGRLVVKLDVEGSERAFLRGARRLIRARRPAILFEMNPAAERAAGDAPGSVLEELAGLGYRRIAELDEYPSAHPLPAVSTDRLRNLVALPPEGVTA